MAHMVETMMYSLAEGLPWHGIGTPVPEAADSEQALVKAGLAWAVRKEPLFVMRDGEYGPYPVPVEGYVATVRSTDRKVLGIVSSRYRVVQNAEAFRFADALLGHGVRYTTAGSLRGGRRIFLCALLPDEVRLVGDEVAPYLVLTNSHDGSSAVRVAVTPVRVVCMNTLNLALAEARRSWSTLHVGDLQGRIREAAETLGLARTYLKALAQEAERLAERRIDLEAYVARLLPIPEDATNRAKKAIEERRASILTAAEVDNLKPFSGTAWALVNAVADVVAHREPTRNTTTFRERRAERIIDGHSLLDAAYRMVASN